MKMRITGAVIIATIALIIGPATASAQGNSCWGQATAVFAQTGVMGEHASQQDEPRLGLARLARALYEEGIIEAPTLAALGAFVADELGLDISRCTKNLRAVRRVERAVANQAACWGQASAVFAQLGMMGGHASSQPNPRLGLANLARLLYEAGVIEAPTMAALGAFVATELGLEIDACQ